MFENRFTPSVLYSFRWIQASCNLGIRIGNVFVTFHTILYESVGVQSEDERDRYLIRYTTPRMKGLGV